MPTPGPRTPYRHSDVFKATAVRLSQLPGVSVRDMAESLYVHPFILSRGENWSAIVSTSITTSAYTRRWDPDRRQNTNVDAPNPPVPISA
jgi:hypothetical protein